LFFRLYRANFQHIWDFLVEHVKTESEGQLIRGALVANGIAVAGIVDDKDQLADDKQQLLKLIEDEEELHARQETEVRQLNKELSAFSSALVEERNMSREVRSRALINEATDRVLDASLQVYEEYGRRLSQETERLSFFTSNDEDFLLDSELMSRTQLLQQLLVAARGDEKMIRETVAEQEKPDSTVDLMLYDLQRQHIAQFVESHELRASSGSRVVAPVKTKDLAQEAVELREAVKILQFERDKMVQGQSDKLLLEHDLKDRVQELASLQREMKVVQDQIEAMLIEGGAARSALLELGSDVRSLIHEHVLSLQDSFEPLAEQLRDSVQRELDQFDRCAMSHLVRSTVSPQAAGLPPPLICDLRIYTSKYVLSSIALLLEFQPTHSFDHFLSHVQSLALEVRRGAAAPAVERSVDEADERIGGAFAKEMEDIKRAVVPVYQRVESATQQVEALKEAVEKAFLEWKNLPAQFCIPQEEQKERFVRRYNYLRVLAHDAAAKLGQK
jgi:hypothetical protein